jgi:hypothetical protein
VNRPTKSLPKRMAVPPTAAGHYIFTSSGQIDCEPYPLTQKRIEVRVEAQKHMRAIPNSEEALKIDVEEWKKEVLSQYFAIRTFHRSPQRPAARTPLPTRSAHRAASSVCCR